MSVRDGGDDELDVGDPRLRARGGYEAIGAPENEGGGMSARWRARLRRQREERSEVKDRRQRPRPEHTDRRLAELKAPDA